MLKFGNITLVRFAEQSLLSIPKDISSQACPLTKGAYYYMHDFFIDESKFPMPLPEGEFRVDSNVSASLGGTVTHLYSSELYFKTVKE